MSDKWNGVPLNPEQRRWHWLSWQGEEPGLYEWVGQYWIMGGGNPPLDYVAEHFTYLGPSLTPAEVDARVKDALKWRDAINAALTNWLCPIEDHETPADAMQRLIRLEVMAALDPAVSKSAADLVAAARKEWLAELNHDTDALMEAARQSALAEAARAMIEKIQSMVIRPDTPEAWRFAILQDLREMAGEKPEIITTAIRVLSDTPPDTYTNEAEQERDEFFNRLGRVTEELRLPMDATASRIIEAIRERVDNEREACASVSVKVEARAKEARRDALEEAARLAKLYAQNALKCAQCGDIRHDYIPGNCSGEKTYRESEEYKKKVLFDGEYSAMRYFQKHLCRPEPMDQDEAFKALAAAIQGLSDAPPGTMSGQSAKQDLRAADCIKQWPECESGAYDPRCCRFPKSCSCESGELKGEGND